MPKIIGVDQIEDWDIANLDSQDLLDMIFDSADGYVEFMNFVSKQLNCYTSFDEVSSLYKIKYKK